MNHPSRVCSSLAGGVGWCLFPASRGIAGWGLVKNPPAIQGTSRIIDKRHTGYTLFLPLNPLPWAKPFSQALKKSEWGRERVCLLPYPSSQMRTWRTSNLMLHLHFTERLITRKSIYCFISPLPVTISSEQSMHSSWTRQIHCSHLLRLDGGLIATGGCFLGSKLSANLTQVNMVDRPSVSKSRTQQRAVSRWAYLNS